MLTAAIINLTLARSPPDGIAPPYEFDPVTAEVTEDENGALEVLAFDRD